MARRRPVAVPGRGRHLQPQHSGDLSALVIPGISGCYLLPRKSEALRWMVWDRGDHSLGSGDAEEPEEVRLRGADRLARGHWWSSAVEWNQAKAQDEPGGESKPRVAFRSHTCIQCEVTYLVYKIDSIGPLMKLSITD